MISGDDAFRYRGAPMHSCRYSSEIPSVYKPLLRVNNAALCCTDTQDTDWTWPGSKLQRYWSYIIYLQFLTEPLDHNLDKGLFHFSVTQGTLTNEEIHHSSERAMVEQTAQRIGPDDYAEQFAKHGARHQAGTPAEQSRPDIDAELPALELQTN